MPAIASLEDLKAAQKEGLVFTLCSMRSALCYMEMAQDRLEKCVWSPMGKGRAIQRLGGGDIPAPSEWSSLPGQALAWRTDSGTVERRRESVNSVDLFSFSRGQLKTWN